ncbi:hypothetical protein MVEN_00010200 [Mycena venus]|uniref:Uncharacterized protein n=1 Tax=Mycena venus TaxID=2733690 RepID=A0A8H6Z644_9AGAR|nr:hypothetical protein MVEN_00010200 [Mycena venus]
MNTRVGEGFQQEVSEMYEKTNGKNAEHQISILDENEETMARLDMQVELWRRSHEEDSNLNLIPSSNPDGANHWKLGSADSRVTPHVHRLEMKYTSNQLFRNFDMRLREYLAYHHPAFSVRPEDNIEIEPCKVIYVEYASKVDWKSAKDILRCNPWFHGHPRYDSILYTADDDPMAMGQLDLVFRCHLPRHKSIDLAMIQSYRTSSWNPKTRTDCPVREKSAAPMFIALEHLTRGALLCPIFGASREVFYVVDCVDEDMFLRVNYID